MRGESTVNGRRFAPAMGLCLILLVAVGTLLSCSEQTGSNEETTETAQSTSPTSGSTVARSDERTDDPVSSGTTPSNGGAAAERDEKGAPEMSDRTWFRAAARGRVDTIRKGLKQGVDPDRTMKKGRTALMLAAYGGHTEVVRLLIEHGADVSVEDVNGRTALIMASSGNFPDTVRLLLKHGADPNKRGGGQDGWTPLMMAAGGGHKPVVKVLLEHGADPSLKDEDGHTASDHARNSGHREVAELLK